MSSPISIALTAIGVPAYRSDETVASSKSTSPIAPITLCAIALWVACAILYWGLEELSLDKISLIIAITAGSSLALCAIFAIKRRILLAVLLFLSLGALLATCEICQFKVSAASIPSPGEYEITFLSDSRTGSRSNYADIEVMIDDRGSVKARAFFEGDRIYLGQKAFAHCSFSSASEEYRRSNYMSGTHFQANIDSLKLIEGAFPLNLINDLRVHAIEVLNDAAMDDSGLLQALLCGYRPKIAEGGDYDIYKKCGIAHIVAVSGAHLAIVAFAVSFFLKALRLPRKAYIATSLFFIFAYLIFAGAPISAIRASIMCALALVSPIAKRRSATLGSLSICVIAMIVIDPCAAVSISLFLSAASTFAIVSLSDIFTSWARKAPRIFQEYIVSPIALTISSNIATLPFSAALFNMLPLISPIANLLIAPIFTLTSALGLIALIASLACPALSEIALFLPSVLSKMMHGTCAFLSSFPMSCLDVEPNMLLMLALSAATMIALLIFRPKVPGKAIAAFMTLTALIVFIYVPKAPMLSTDKIVMLDVGQGDAFLVQSQGATLLIDTGNEDYKLKESLRYAGVDEIDAVCISHADADHCASIDAIDCLSENAKFLFASEMSECPCSKCGNLLDTAEELFGIDGLAPQGKGARFKVGNFCMEVLWPETFSDKGGNADSLCLLAELDVDDDGIDDWRALFTGDAERDELKKIIDAQKDLDIDVLKVGHHGSKASLTIEEALELSPSYALISSGENNSYGHPSKESLEALEASGTKVLRSDESGVVSLFFKKDAIEIDMQKG